MDVVFSDKHSTFSLSCLNLLFIRRFFIVLFMYRFYKNCNILIAGVSVCNIDLKSWLCEHSAQYCSYWRRKVSRQRMS